MARRPDLSGQAALVTGASGGLGSAIARALHSAGANLKLSGRRGDALEALRDELGERAELLPADLAQPGGAIELAERAGAVDVLVANAGLSGAGLLPEYTLEQVDRVLDVNLRSAVHLTHALLPGMLERGRGHLVYISSIAGKTPTGGASLYAATKFGLRGIALALHEDLRGTGVGATAICPGFIGDAGIWAETEFDLPPGRGRLRRPDEVADAVLTALATNRPEIDVGSVVERAGGWFTGIAPRLVAGVMRRAGGARISAAIAESQRAKR